ncbi:hypothetical protein VKA52_18465 [Halobacillus sp. HZG1]|uniref:hypothetical protein n=1 Tax=Halobacillus sp. HZG1 TaxID=3111769 RepID=UPI002DB70DFC|nr:hypothetical protein [Halobacillus sp. HZG1]MEC3885710.1 hypothetical protein [Halobacillus sp. HZG1]
MLWLIFAIPGLMILVTLFFDRRRNKGNSRIAIRGTFEDMYRNSSAKDRAGDPKHSKPF